MPRAGFVARVMLAGVRGYQVLLSPLFAGSCRYVPSCSHYMAEALERHGALRGGWLGLKRLGRCHPFGSSGFDPVPDAGPDAGPSSRAALVPGSDFPAPENHSRSDFPGNTPKITPGVIC